MEVFNLESIDRVAVEHGLGLEGCGAVALRSVLSEEFRLSLVDEIKNPEAIVWQDAGDTYTNARGVVIEQNHDVFALKLSRGSQKHRKKVPYMDQLNGATQSLVRSLEPEFPSLAAWKADEMSYHRYYEKEKGLTFHRDNKRFTGLIAVVSVLGECDFQVIDREPSLTVIDEESGKSLIKEWNWKSTYTIPTRPGDVVLTRAPGLFELMDDDEDRPEHAVMNVRVLPRISFMLRANKRPSDTGYGFQYHNWNS